MKKTSKYLDSEKYILDNYKRKTMRELREYIGCSNTTLNRIVDSLGIREDLKRYNYNRIVDETIEERPDGNWFYFVGLMLADGWIKGNLVNIRLSEKDNQLVEDLSKWLQYRGAICRATHIAPNGKEVTALQISFSSKIISDLLRYYGVSDKKTGNEDYRNIPDEYLCDFFRGFMDGDGNVVPRSGIRLYSMSNVVYKLADDLSRVYGIEYSKYKNRIQAVGILKENVINILRPIMYRDPDCLCLHRKRELVMSMVCHRKGYKKLV